MVRLGVLAGTLAVVILLSVAGGVAAEEVGVETGTAPDVDATAQDRTVEVTVVDRSGERLSDIDVTATWDDGEGTDQTRSDGRALIDVPRDTTVAFSVSDPDGEYVKNHQPVVVSDVAGSEVTIEMAEVGDVEFTVVDANGEPVEDVRLDLFHEGDDREVANATTGSSGVATVNGIEQRSYDVETDRAGYNTAESSFTLDRAAATETIEIESNRVEVSFLVLDNHFEPPRPLEGATIEIAEFGTLPRTFADGTQDQSLPVNDEYEITVSKEGYDSGKRILHVRESPRSVNLSIQRTPTITIDQLQDSVVVGQPTLVTITNSYSEPVAGASVSLNGDAVGATDEQGQIVFNVTSVGENELSASSGGLSASGTITGVDPDPEPPEDIGDEADDDDDTNETDDGETDDDDAVGPGFGVLAAAGALVALTGLLARRVRDA